MTYNQKTANPFVNGKSEWSSNNLLLKEPSLRAKAGVSVLDAEVTDAFHAAQTGGGASGAPFSIKNYGASNARQYDQEGGGLPRKFFDSGKLW